MPWRSSGWTNNRNVTQLLELMVQRGEVAVAGRAGGDRLWDLAERVYPDDPVVPAGRGAADPQRAPAARAGHRPGPRARSARSSRCDVGEAGEPAVVEGVKGSGGSTRR